MALILTLLLTALAPLLGAALLFLTWHFDYWSRRGVPYYNFLSPRSLLSGRAKWRRFTWEALDDVYERFRGHGFAGSFEWRTPVLVVREPELVKQVLTKQFSSFHDRGVPYDEERDPLSGHLLNLAGDKWRYMRAKLSPTFTSGRLKLMFGLVAEVTDELNAVLRASAVTGEEVELKALLTRFSTDVIGSCAFGVRCNSLTDPASEFYAMGRAVFDLSAFAILRFLFVTALSSVFPSVSVFRRVFARHTVFFVDLMKETVAFRKSNNVDRNDFVKLMMQLRAADEAEEGSERTSSGVYYPFTENTMAAQAFLFFLAGLDNVSNTIGFCLNELAHDEDLQARVAAEVREATARHGCGRLTYEAVRQMELLGRVVSEALRLWVPLSFLTRVVTRPVRLPGSDLTLEPGLQVRVPVWQLHHDPDHFPDPERFDPERFTAEAEGRRHPYAYLPFGEGPRFCVAERFARMEIELCLAAVVADFRLLPGARSQRRPPFNPRSFTPTPKDGFWLRLEKRQSCETSRPKK